jgi:hypothetical protein
MSVRPEAINIPYNAEFANPQNEESAQSPFEIAMKTLHSPATSICAADLSEEQALVIAMSVEHPFTRTKPIMQKIFYSPVAIVNNLLSTIVSNSS